MGDDRTIYSIGVDHYNEKQYDQAISLFGQLPNSDTKSYLIGTCYKDKNTLDDMLLSQQIFVGLLSKDDVDSELMIHIKANYVSVVTMLTFYYQQHSDYQSAIKVLTEGLNNVPNHHVLLYNLGYIHHCSGNYYQAIHWLVKSLERDSHLDKTYIELINIYRELKDSELVLKYINQAIEQVEHNATFYNDLGLYYSGIDTQKAKNAFQKGIDQSKDDPVLNAKIANNLSMITAVQ